MKIPAVNAFTINRLGLKDGAMFFPLSLEVSRRGKVITTSICAQRMVDLCDIIEKHALDYLVIFDVEGYELDELTGRPLPLQAIARRAAVQFTAIDSETIIVPTGNIPSLLPTFHHYDLHLFDMANDRNELQVISQVLACREHDWRSQQAVLPNFPASTFFFDSHDDCYLTIESCSPELSKDVFVRTLQIFAGAILAQKAGSAIEIAEMPHELLNAFWQDEFGLTMLEEWTQTAEDRLEIGVSRQAFRFGEGAEYSMDFWLVYKMQSQEWFLEM